MPEELFQPYTHAKTCVVAIEKNNEIKSVEHEIFMAIAKWCGHDSRGLQIPYDDIPKIQSRYDKNNQNGTIAYDHLGFTIKESEVKNGIYLPKYYTPEIPKKLSKLTDTHDLIVFEDLVKKGILGITTGDEVGKLSYGTGNIPFIRSSDIANWEIKIDPKHGLSEDIYNKYKEKQDIKVDDILMVRDGTYLIGTCAIITRLDTKIVFQSHLYKIRSNDYTVIHPYLLIAVLSCPVVKEQIYAKRFTQDIIDTLGSGVNELILPIPKDEKLKNRIVSNIENVIKSRCNAKEITRKTVLEVTPIHDFNNEDYSFLTMSK